MGTSAAAKPPLVSWALSRLRVMYFCLGLEAAVFVPFFALLLARCGLSASQVGAVMAARQLAGLLSAPVFGSLADERGRSGTMLRLFLVLRALPLAAFLVQFLMCDGAAASQAMSAADESWRWRLPWSWHSETAAFWAFTATAVLGALVQTPVSTLLDSSTLTLLGSDRLAYGSVRGWLSVGMACGAVAAGLVLQHLGGALCWASQGLFMVVDTVVGMRLGGRLHAATTLAVQPSRAICSSSMREPAQQCVAVDVSRDGAVDTRSGNVSPTAPSAPRKASTTQGSAWSRLATTLSNWHLVLFLAVSMVNGIGSAAYDTYLVLFLNQLSAPGWMLGAAVGTGCGSNVLFFMLSAPLLRVFGCRWMLAVAMVAFVVRMWLYSIVQQAWMVLPVQMLHGINFSCMWAAGVEFTRQHATESTVATAQSLFQAAFFGVGGLAGLYAGGWLFDWVGARDMFLFKGAATAVMLVVFVAAEALPHSCKHRHARRSHVRGGERSSLLAGVVQD